MKSSLVKVSTLGAAIFAATSATAGGFDNTDRNFDIIYGDSNIITTQYGQTAVPMKANINKVQRAQTSVAEANAKVVGSGEVIGDHIRPQIGFRYQLAKGVTCAAKVEQPFATKISFADDQYAYIKTNSNGLPIDANGNPTADPSNMATAGAPIDTRYESESFTMACGYTMALSQGQITAFAGPKIQRVSGFFNQDLTPSPTDLGEADNLTVELDGGTEFGYVAGMAYEIPEIALRASFLYHSQVDYDAKGSITAKIPGAVSFSTTGTARTFTPQTLELALKSGLAENTLGFIKMRWSEYSKLSTLNVTGDDSKTIDGSQFTIAQANQASGNLLDPLINPGLEMFTNDTFDYTIGIGQRISDQLSLGTSFTGSTKLGSKPDNTPAGADSTSLRLPNHTSYTLAFGGEYALMKHLKLHGGLGYTFIDSFIIETPTEEFKAEFGKTEATSFQFGLTYEI